MSKKVFIGAGHGGSDSGAVANGFKEKDLNLAIALSCRDELKRQGVDVLLSRTTDYSETLTGKIERCNAFKPDLALDIHNNAGGGDGAECYHHYGGGTGKVFAQNILASIVEIGQNSRGTKIKKNSSGADYFGFIRQTDAPAVIVECAFMDSKDIETVNTPEKQKAMGIAIAKGVLKTLGIAWTADGAGSFTSAGGSGSGSGRDSDGSSGSGAASAANSANAAGNKSSADWTSYIKAVQTAVGALADGIAGSRTLAACPTLRQGSAHKAVKPVQNRLNYIGHSCGDADGIFGVKTAAAVKDFQKANGLTVDGIIGQNTWKKLLGVK